MIGGVFSRPAESWPHIFGNIALLSNYPYFLPCTIAAMIPLSAFVFTFLFLKEVSLDPMVLRMIPSFVGADIAICYSTQEENM